MTFDALKQMPKDPRIMAKVFSLMRKASKISEEAPKKINVQTVKIIQHEDGVSIRLGCDPTTAYFISQFAEYQDIFPLFLNRAYENPEIFLSIMMQMKQKAEPEKDVSEEELQNALEGLKEKGSPGERSSIAS
jgi:hypothetical protein